MEEDARGQGRYLRKRRVADGWRKREWRRRRRSRTRRGLRKRERVGVGVGAGRRRIGREGWLPRDPRRVIRHWWW